MVTDDSGDPDDDTKPETPLSLSQLAITPQLQLAIRVLGMPTSALPQLLASWHDEYPGTIAELAPGEVDPYDERERELAVEEGTAPWFYFDEEPLPQLGADVWIFGDPPAVRANGRAHPRMKVAFDDSAMTRSAIDARRASWLVRALRQRARTFEAVVAAVVARRPELATAPDPSGLPPVGLREIAGAVGMHESSIRRVVSVCRFQTPHGVMRFVATSAAAGFARDATPRP